MIYLRRNYSLFKKKHMGIKNTDMLRLLRVIRYTRLNFDGY